MKTVGGTMASRILGLSRWGGPLSAYFELTGEPVDLSSAATSRGVALEQSVLALWGEREEKTVVPWCAGDHHMPLKGSALPHAHASVDAFVRGDGTILDAKTLAREALSDDWGSDGTDRVPVEYQVQLLWYLGVYRSMGWGGSGVEEALLPVLTGPEVELQWAARLVAAVGRPLRLADMEGTGLELRCYRVEWDGALFDELNARVLAFLREHVDPRVPPEPGPGDLSERDMRAVGAAWRAEPGRVLEAANMPAAQRAHVEAYREAVAQRKAWANAEEQAAVRVKLAMGTADELRLADGARVTWRSRQDGVRVFKMDEPRRKQ